MQVRPKTVRLILKSSAYSPLGTDPSNLKGSVGATTSRIFHADSPDYMNVSVNWDADANIGEHSCAAWLAAVTDGCDVPRDHKDSNAKHGGTIAYESQVTNATMRIEPLVMKRIWNRGRAGGQQCDSTDSRFYVDQATLQSNIDEYCTKFAAQPGGIAESGSTFRSTFNDDRPDRVEIVTQWPRGPRDYQIFEDECRYYMAVIK